MNKYNELLKNQIWASAVPIAVILALSLMLFLLNKKHFSMTWENWQNCG